MEAETSLESQEIESYDFYDEDSLESDDENEHHSKVETYDGESLNRYHFSWDDYWTCDVITIDIDEGRKDVRITQNLTKQDPL